MLILYAISTAVDYLEEFLAVSVSGKTLICSLWGLNSKVDWNNILNVETFF